MNTATARTVMAATKDGQIIIVRETYANLKQRREMRKRGHDVPENAWIVRGRVIAPHFGRIPEMAKPWLSNIEIEPPLTTEIKKLLQGDPVRFTFAVIALRHQGFTVKSAAHVVRQVMKSTFPRVSYPLHAETF